MVYNYKLIISNVLLGSGLITSPYWLTALTIGTAMANDSGRGNQNIQSLALCSLFATPVALIYSLGHNIIYKQYNSFISSKLPLIPIVSYVGLMFLFFKFPKRKQNNNNNNNSNNK